MRRTIAAVAALLLGVVGCSSDAAANTLSSLRERIAGIDVEAILDQAGDCDRLSELFVGAVATAADLIDTLADRTDGRLPQTQIRDLVDEVSVNRFYELAERLGCTQIQVQVNTIEGLRNLVTRTPEAGDFVGEVRQRVEEGNRP